MTIGGLTRSVGRVQPRSASSRRRWVDEPRIGRHLPTVLACTIFAAMFLRYRQQWFIPGYSGYLLNVHQTVVAGTAIAPNQYRPLIPWLAFTTSQATGVTLPHAILVLDALLLVVAVVTLHQLAGRFDAPPLLLLAAAAGFALWFTKLDAWSPETMALIALVAVVVREVTADRPRWWLVALAGLLMLGARTDYAATLGVTVLAVAAHRRSWSVAGLAVAVGAGAAAATLGWVRLYPQAH